MAHFEGKAGDRDVQDIAMSLQPQEDFSVPYQTRRIALAAFPKGCACLCVGDVLGCVYQDRQFAILFPRRGQPAEAPGRLALATVLQFMECLSDRQAADAVRARIDWKYALGLELTDCGFDHTVLSEFRTPPSGEDDPYCYPGTNILRNKLGIRDERQLQIAETVIGTLRDTQLNLFGPADHE